MAAEKSSWLRAYGEDRAGGAQGIIKQTSHLLWVRKSYIIPAGEVDQVSV